MRLMRAFANNTSSNSNLNAQANGLDDVHIDETEGDDEGDFHEIARA